MKKLSLFVSSMCIIFLAILDLSALDEKSPAPDFTLNDLDGRAISLSSLKGKVVLLNFWGTFCVPCRKEMPSMETLYKTYKDKGFLVVAVSADKSVEDVRDFIKDYKITFLVVIDKDKKVAKQYRVSSLPTSFLLNKNGLLSKRFFGDRDWADKESKNMVELLISE